MKAEWSIVVLTAVLVGATIWYASTTQGALKAARKANREAGRANDLAEQMRRDQFGATIDVQSWSGGSGSRGPHITCALANTGRRTAFDVTATAVIEGSRIPSQSPIPSMPSGSNWPQQRCYFLLGTNALGTGDADPLPRFEIEVTYRDSFGSRCENFACVPPGQADAGPPN